MTTTKYSIGVHAYGWPPFEAKLWQRSYHDHIIRNEDDLMRIRDYIVNNPAQWETDENNPLVGDDLHVVPSQKKGEGPRHIRGGHTGPPLHTVLTLLLFGIMMTCLTGCKPENTQNAVGTLPPQGEPGELVFVNNCAGCHAGGSNSMNPAKPVRGSGKLTDKQTFIAFLRNPSGTMPPYDKAAISDEQAAQLLLYVKKAFH